MNTEQRSRFPGSLFVALVVASCSVARADLIEDWNAEVDVLATDQKLQPPAHARVLALMHLSMFEAVNAIDRRYVPYALTLDADRDSSREAAIAAAGHAILLAEFPRQSQAVDALLAKSLQSVDEGPARAGGLALGERAAAGLLKLRLPDGSELPEAWRPLTSPGVYVPTATVAGSTVPRWRPWVMSSAAQFRPSPPPALESETWTRDFNEIRAIGSLTSTTRSAEQTDVGRFWFLTGPRTWMQIVQHVVSGSKLDLTDRTRVYALVSMAAADSFIAVFDAKYTYNLWRPVTAIRNADQTGNPATLRDATWVPLGDTPMHPEYPCAHCISSAAVAVVLGGLFGDDLTPVSVNSPAAPGVVRRFTHLGDYETEVSNARVWAGFHYRFSTEVGRDMGHKIATLTLATQLKRRKQ